MICFIVTHQVKAVYTCVYKQYTPVSYVVEIIHLGKPIIEI